jgi:hypothetical protein
VSMTQDWDSVGRVVGPAAADPWDSVGRIVPTVNRSPIQRARENIKDAWERSGAGSLQRSLDPQNDGVNPVADFFLTPQILEGGNADRVLDATLGPDRGFLRTVNDQTRRDAPMIARERARRAEYDARAAADPIRGVGDFAGFMTGQVLGSAFSPESWVGPGKTALTRIAGNAAVGAGTDALLQGNDIGAGVQDNYSPTQTLIAGGVGGVIQGGFEVGGAAGRRAGPVIGRAADVAGNVAAAGRSAWDQVGAVVGANPVPAFDGPSMDVGAAVRPRGAVASPLGHFGQPRPSARTQRPSVAIPEPFRPAIEQASADTGVSSSYLASLAQRESSFNPTAQADTSSARGLYQFTEGTWLATLAQHGDRLGLPGIANRIRTDRAGVLALRDNPDLAIRAAALHTQDNAAGLRQVLGRDPTDAELYSAHFLGEGGARRLATADDGANAAALFPDAADANRSIFYNEGRPRSVAEVRAQLARGFDGTGSTAGVGYAGDPSRPRVSESEALTYPGQGEEAAGAMTGRPGQGEPQPLGTQGLGMTDPALGVRQAEAPGAARPVEMAQDFTTPRAPEAAPDPARLAMMGDHPSQWDAVGARVDQAAPDSWDAVGARVDTPDRLAIDMSQYRDQIGQTVQSSGQARSGLREAPRPDAVARGAGDTFQGKSVSQLADDLRSALGLTHRQGRVGARGALGTYDTGSGVVRTKAVDELDVLAHEATHALEYERKGPALTAALKANGKHLETLAYPGAAQGVRREEGFAEFGRWYLTNPDHARRIAPQFYDAFEQAMAADAPEVLAGMKAVQSGYQNLLGSASIDVAKGSLAYTGSKGPVGNLVDEVKRRGPGSVVRRLADKVYTALIDDLHPLHIAERELSKLYLENSGQKLDLKRAASPYALARLSREAYAAGHGDLMNGVTPYHGMDPEGVSLADALETAGLDTSRLGSFKQDALDEFDVYLIARRMVHEWDRYSRGELPNPPDRNTRQFHEQVMADAEAANPTWAQAAGQVYDFLNNLWRKEFEAGLITEESYKHGMTAHPDYVPLMRDMSDKGPGKAGKPRGALQFAGGVKAFEGSSRDIISPLSSIMRRAYELNAIIKRNDVMKALDDMAQAAGRGAGAIVERLPAKEIEAFTVNAADALNKTADELGLTGRDLSTMQKFADDAAANDAMITLFKQSEFSPRKGEAVVFVWKDGQKTPLLLPDGEFGQQMFTALSGMNKELSNIVVDSMAAATMALRYGVTLSPEFMAANIIRDSLATWINTDVGFVPVLDTIRGGAMELKQGQTAQRYGMVGGMRGGTNTAATRKPFPRTDAEAAEQLQHLRRKGWKVSVRGFAQLTDLSETATRLGVFAKSFEKAKRSGLNEYDALIEAGFTSRDYLDFGRRGSKMLTASRVVTFLNAALQGLDKSVRVLSAGGNLRSVLLPLTKEAMTPAEKAAQGHAYKALAKIATLGAFGLGLRMLYADDPEYQEINDRLRATHWIYRANGQWIFIPKPFELATVSNALERAFEGVALKDPLAGEHFLSDLRHTVVPPSEIPALAVPFHIARNRDYLGRPIVADHLKGTVDPELQFNSYTSDLGKLIGRTLNVSPAVVDYVITGFGGSLGRYALQGSNLVGEAVTGRARTAAGPEDMFLARRFVRSIARGANSQAEFWDQIGKDGGEMTRAEGTFRNLMKSNKDAEAIAYLNGLAPEDRAYVEAKVFSEDGSSRDHPMIRAQSVVSVLSDFRTSLKDGSLRDNTGAVIDITPRQRRAIDTAMADMAVAEMRNALIETGVEGWAQKAPLSTMAAAERIGRSSPEVALQLRTWLAQAKAPTVFAPQALAATQQRWAARAPSMTAQADPTRLQAWMERERMGGDRLDRYQETQRRRGAMTGQTVQQTNPAAATGPRFMTGGQ